MTRSHRKNQPDDEVHRDGRTTTGDASPADVEPGRSAEDVSGGPVFDGIVEPGLSARAGASDQTVKQLSEELEGLRDRHLRLAAEYENFRKRTSRERSETWSRAQADVVSSILDALDDLGRVLDIDPAIASTQDVMKGVELVERKLVRELGSAGLERVGEVGESFDPNRHEAIGSIPAASAEEDHTVGSVLQVGYRFGGALLRPAKVQVRLWDGSGSDGHV
jgi:molecular chaperone GrpE